MTEHPVGLSIRGGTKVYPGTRALKNVDFDLRMGAVNVVARHVDLEREALQVAAEVNGKSPTAQRMLKFAFNLLDDGLMGQQVFAGEATRLIYGTDEAQEGRDSFLEKRDPDWAGFPYHF